MSSQHLFDQAVALKMQADGRFLGHTSPAYANMVGPFGGITAAQAVNAVLQHPDFRSALVTTRWVEETLLGQA